MAEDRCPIHNEPYRMCIRCIAESSAEARRQLQQAQEELAKAKAKAENKRLRKAGFAGWRVSMTKDDGHDSVLLLTADARHAATVWDNGAWHTWDANGIGGENSREANIVTAMREAQESAESQGFLRATEAAKDQKPKGHASRHPTGSSMS